MKRPKQAPPNKGKTAAAARASAPSAAAAAAVVAAGAVSSSAAATGAGAASAPAPAAFQAPLAASFNAKAKAASHAESVSTQAALTLADTFESWQELLECPRCHDLLNIVVPKVLPCGHTFCRDCLVAMMATNDAQSTITCSTCAKAFHTRHGSVDILPTNLLVQRLVGFDVKMLLAFQTTALQRLSSVLESAGIDMKGAVAAAAAGLVYQPPKFASPALSSSSAAAAAVPPAFAPRVPTPPPPPPPMTQPPASYMIDYADALEAMLDRVNTKGPVASASTTAPAMSSPRTANSKIARRYSQQQPGNDSDLQYTPKLAELISGIDEKTLRDELEMLALQESGREENGGDDDDFFEEDDVILPMIKGTGLGDDSLESLLRFPVSATAATSASDGNSRSNGNDHRYHEDEDDYDLDFEDDVVNDFGGGQPPAPGFGSTQRMQFVQAFRKQVTDAAAASVSSALASATAGSVRSLQEEEEIFYDDDGDVGSDEDEDEDFDIVEGQHGEALANGSNPQQPRYAQSLHRPSKTYNAVLAQRQLILMASGMASNDEPLPDSIKRKLEVRGSVADSVSGDDRGSETGPSAVSVAHPPPLPSALRAPVDQQPQPSTSLDMVTEVCRLIRQICESPSEAKASDMMNAVLSIRVLLENPDITETTLANLVNDEDGIQFVLLKMLQTPTLNDDLVAECLHILGLLVSHGDNDRRFLNPPYECQKSVVAVMEQRLQSAQIQLEACCFFANASCSLGVQALLASLSERPMLVHQHLLNAMRQHMDVVEIQRHACRALSNLVIRGDNKSLFVHEPFQAHSAVLAAMRKYPAHADIQRRGCSFIATLSLKVENVPTLLAPGNMAHEVILRAMQRFPNNCSLQRNGCLAITSWTTNLDLRRLLTEYSVNACAAILDAMQKHADSELLQRDACRALCNFSVDGANRPWLVRPPFSAPEWIVSAMVRFSSNPQILPAGINALIYLAFDDGSPAGGTHPALDVLLQKMRAHPFNQAFQQAACSLLGTLAFADGYRAGEIQQRLIERPYMAHEAILVAMRTFPMDGRLQQSGCRALACLAGDDAIEQLLMNPPFFAHKVVLDAMRAHPDSPDVQVEGCRALEMFAVSGDHDVLLVKPEFNAHIAILTAMTRHINDADVQDEGCMALANLTVSDDNKNLLTAAPAFAHTAILHAMHVHAKEQTVQRNACTVIGNLVHDHKQNAILVASAPHNGHELILHAMRRFSSYSFLQASACRALAGLTAVDSIGKLALQAPLLVHEAIIAAMRTFQDDDQVQHTGFLALRNCIKNADRELRKQFVSAPLLVHELILRAMRHYPDFSELQLAGCNALWVLALSDDENKEILVRAPHRAHEVILEVMKMHTDDAEVQRSAFNVIAALASIPSIRRLLTTEPHKAQQIVLESVRRHPNNQQVQDRGTAALRSLGVAVGSAAK